MGDEPFAMELEAGERTIVAVDAKGRSAAVAIKISNHLNIQPPTLDI
jgi:hypothetical protein